MRKVGIVFFTIMNVWLFSLFVATPIKAQTIDHLAPVKAMISKAVTHEDGEHFLTVLEIAIEAYPEDMETLAVFAIERVPAQEMTILTWLKENTEENIVVAGLPVEERIAILEEKAKSAPKPAFFAPRAWDGEVSAGGSFLTGNTEEKAINIGIQLDRISDDWEHHLGVLADYSRNDNRTTKERIISNYDAKWFYLERGYIFGLMNFELDSFSEFDWRLSQAAGLGYRIYESDKVAWDIEGGPGLRETKLAGDGVETEFIFAGRSTYRWQIRDNITLNDTASVFVGSTRTTFTNNVNITADFTESLAGRLGFYVKYDTSVPLFQEKLDTATRASIVYGF